MPIVIPRQQRNIVKAFLELSADDRERIVATLSDVARTHSSLARFTDDVEQQFDVPPELDRAELMRAFVTMNMTRHRSGESAITFAEGFVKAAQADGLGSQGMATDDTFWKRVEEQLAAILSNPTLELVSKAARLARAHEREFLDAVIVSDLRPIFHPDTKLGPAAMLIAHTLRIEHTGSSDELEIVLELDDLRKMKVLVDRAIAKDEALREFTRNAKLPIYAEEDT